jgi:hypothetical protein
VLSEQHFLKETCTVSAPEGYLADIAARTTRLRLRTIRSLAGIQSSDPGGRVADHAHVLSNGRAELGLARSNNLHTLEGFGINPAESRQWNGRSTSSSRRSRAIRSSTGAIWSVPPRSVTAGRPAAPSSDLRVGDELGNASQCRERGIGVMTGNSILGWEYAGRCIPLPTRGKGMPR